MRIAIIVPRIDQLGPVKVIQTLVNSLSKNETLKINLFYLDRNVDPHVNLVVPTEQLDHRHFRFGDYDIIHTTGIRPDLFAFINRRKIKCHISTIHNFVFEDLTFTYNRLISFLFGSIWLILWKRADKLVCVSEVLKAYYTKWFPSEKLEAIHNGIAETDNLIVPDAEVIEVILNFKSKGYKVLGTAGVLNKLKGIDQLLNLIATEKRHSLVIFGKGKEFKNLNYLAEKLKISERCRFLGFRSNAVNYFKYFDSVIIPSRSEGFGLALVEAVQQKVPLICSDLPVFKELFNSDEVTFFKLEDITSLTQSLITSLELGNTKANLAYARYKDQFTDHVMAKKYYDLYFALSSVL